MSVQTNGPGDLPWTPGLLLFRLPESEPDPAMLDLPLTKVHELISQKSLTEALPPCLKST